MKDSVAPAKKYLGQHWLTDEPTLAHIAKTAELKPGDVVLEIGPGHGSLTKHLLARGVRVVAVELDGGLAAALAKNHPGNQQLEVIQGDILRLDLDSLPRDYKVVANIPYYLTGQLLRLLTSASNPPASMTLLLQKEVAERIAAQPGKMSILAVSVQLNYEPRLGRTIAAKLFQPPPKVDSRVIHLRQRPHALFKDLDERKFLRVVKAGFSSPRKKLRSSLAGGLGIPTKEADNILLQAEVNGDLRAEALSLQQWHQLYMQFALTKDFRSLLP